MSKLTLRFNSNELKEILQERACNNRRSLNSEINYILMDAVSDKINAPVKKVKTDLELRHNLYVTLPTEIKNIVKKRAETSGRTVQTVLAMLIEEGLSRQNKNDDEGVCQQQLNKVKKEIRKLEKLLRESS